SANGSDEPSLDVASLEVAILDTSRPRRAFRRIGRSTLENLLQETDAHGSDSDSEPSDSEGESSD
ncbi:MAG: proteasome alpha subunit, partial [Mycobacterium sp.]|nr:proteasome alpha subunit [Mycobacterium sp.]